MKFCSECGAPVELKTPPDDNRPRHVCPLCATIHYQNPKLVIGSIPEWEDDRILLCRRAIEPRHGLWTLPAGFMENGETNARVALGDLYSMVNLPDINQVHLLFRAQLLDLDFSPGAESLEVELFEERDIPWDEIAFRAVSMALKNYFADRMSNHFQLHIGDLTAPPSKP